MPPGIGGLQAIVENVEPLYRDIRRLGATEQYRVRLEGLQVGKTYNVNFPMLKGKIQRFLLFDSTGRPIGTKTPGSQYRFVAKGGTNWITVEVQGGGQ